MPRQKRYSTNYAGVFFVEGINPATKKPERVYYIRYKRSGKMVEEKAGRASIDNMTPAKANQLRARRMAGDDATNQEKREKVQAKKDRMTIARLWEAYKENRPGLKGLVTDENRFKLHIKPSFGNKVPAEIVTLDVDRLRLRMLKTRKPATVRNVIELLRRIVNFGVRKGLCPPLDPSRLTFEFPKLNNEKTEDLGPEQLQSLLAAIEEEPNRQVADLMLLALFTGMRRGELFRLKWEHVDYERGFILLVDTKGGVDQKIPLNPAARTLLEQHEVTDSPYVFPGRDGGQRVDIKKQVARIRDRAGLPKNFRPLHGLRHVYASILASSGQVDMYTLQKLMTHKSAAMTQRYAHLRDDALKRAGNVAGDIFNNLGKDKEKKVVNLDAFRDDS